MYPAHRSVPCAQVSKVPRRSTAAVSLRSRLGRRCCQAPRSVPCAQVSKVPRGEGGREAREKKRGRKEGEEEEEEGGRRRQQCSMENEYPTQGGLGITRRRTQPIGIISQDERAPSKRMLTRQGRGSCVRERMMLTRQGRAWGQATTQADGIAKAGASVARATPIAMRVTNAACDRAG